MRRIARGAGRSIAADRGIRTSRWCRLVGAVLLVPAAWAAGDAADPCAEARHANGWCEATDTGYVGGLPLRSKMLWETMDAHGHELDLTTFQCTNCKQAIRTGGFCELHRIGFVHDLAYFSRLTYELARGEAIDPAKLDCPVCRRNAATHGWCDEHRVGLAGDIAIRDRAAWERVAAELELLERASATAERCEYCAVAMVTDTRCPFCRVEYRDGRELPEDGSSPPGTHEATDRDQ